MAVSFNADKNAKGVLFRIMRDGTLTWIQRGPAQG